MDVRLYLYLFVLWYFVLFNNLTYFQVQLQEPVIKHPEKHDRSKPVRLNRQNNVEWDLDIPAGEKKELVLKYTVDCPVLEEVETCVAHSLIGFSEC